MGEGGIVNISNEHKEAQHSVTALQFSLPNTMMCYNMELW